MKPIAPDPTFELTPKQREASRLLSGPQRHTMLVGGARSGKTFLLVRAILIRALRADYSRHLIVRLRYNAVRQAVWLDTLPKVQRLCFPHIHLEWHDRDGYISLPNGSEIWMGGLDDKERTEKILGQEYSTIFFNECSQITYGSVTMALTRLAQKAGLRNRHTTISTRSARATIPTGSFWNIVIRLARDRLTIQKTMLICF